MSDLFWLESAIAAATRAGQLLRDHAGRPSPVTVKESWRDVCTGVDRLAEQAALDVLGQRHPGVAVLCEERGWVGEPSSSDGHWVLDALDGSVNHMHGLPWYAVSLAYVAEGRARAAVVYAPALDELYFGRLGGGAFKNHQALHVADPLPSDSLFAASLAGWSHSAASRTDEWAAIAAVNDASRGCLRTGSAALNLAGLAEGRFNGCWGVASPSWDVSAGLLLAELAGACVQTIEVPDGRGRLSYLAATPTNFEWLQARLRPVLWPT